MTFAEFKEALHKEIASGSGFFIPDLYPDNLPIMWFLGTTIGEFLAASIDGAPGIDTTIKDFKGLSNEELANKIIFIIDSVKDSHLKHDG